MTPTTAALVDLLDPEFFDGLNQWFERNYTQELCAGLIGKVTVEPTNKQLKGWFFVVSRKGLFIHQHGRVEKLEFQKWNIEDRLRFITEEHHWVVKAVNEHKEQMLTLVREAEAMIFPMASKVAT